MDSVKENNFYVGEMWVQCENRSCLKWRLLQQDDVKNIDSSTPWYCYMNVDPQFNKCSVAEEYFPEESQFRKHGLKYVYSKLPLGSLVLAKMKTWPRWPGILSPDPVDGQYVIHDLNGNVESHHVEFLGNPHSRSWTAINYIDPYPSSFKAGTVSDKEAKRKIDRIKCRKMIKSCTKICGKKTSCKNGRKRKQRTLTYPSKIARSEDILSRESLVVTETEIILKDLDKILNQVVVTSKPSSESSGDGEDNNETEEILNCCTEVSEERRPMEINTQEDCIIIDGKAFKAGECIESITEQFKEIDSLMANFQGSL
ncbi:zinc finger CW-type PWWP domain protein 2 [Liasis olivaceus]